MFNKKFLQSIKDILVNEHRQLTNSAALNQEIDTDGDETDEIQANMLIEMNSHLLSRNAAKLVKIEDALRRLDDKSYGLCEDCEEEIPEKRLLANPYYLTCVTCAEQREIIEKQGKRS